MLLPNDAAGRRAALDHFAEYFPAASVEDIPAGDPLPSEPCLCGYCPDFFVVIGSR